MAGDLGDLVRRAFALVRAQNAGFPLSFDLPVDDFVAVLLVKEEQPAYLEERQQRDAEAASIAHEVEKQQQRKGLVRDGLENRNP